MIKGSMVKNLNDSDLSDKHKIAAVQYLYLRYVLGIGDSGPWNLLVRYNPIGNLEGQIVIGIDLEDMCGTIKSMETPIHPLMNQYSNKYKSIYGPYVKGIVQLSDTVCWGKIIQNRITKSKKLLST